MAMPHIPTPWAQCQAHKFLHLGLHHIDLYVRSMREPKGGRPSEPSAFIKKICGHLSLEEQIEAEACLMGYIEIAFEILLDAEKRGVDFDKLDY